MDKITLKVEDKPDVSFTGVHVANTDISNSNDTLIVFETSKGHWLVARMDIYNNLQGYKIIENKNEKDLIANLQYTDSAKNIYSQLNIDYTNKLDI